MLEYSLPQKRKWKFNLAHFNIFRATAPLHKSLVNLSDMRIQISIYIWKKVGIQVQFSKDLLDQIPIKRLNLPFPWHRNDFQSSYLFIDRYIMKLFILSWCMHGDYNSSSKARVLMTLKCVVSFNSWTNSKITMNVKRAKNSHLKLMQSQ